MTPTATHRTSILLVEDDPCLAVMLRDRLVDRGYAVWRSENAAEGEIMADELRPDLFILDLMLPDMHGLVLCANLREKSAAPIIICSATRRKEDPLLGFKLGAVDFVAKPFSCDELEARVETALRHRAPGPAAEPPGEGVEQVGPLVIDQSRRRVTLAGQVLLLTPTEYRLLWMLSTRPNTVHSRQELAERIWGHYDAGIGRSLEVHLRRLRAKLEAGPVAPPALRAVRGFGYQLAWETGGEGLRLAR
jgi:DNA-binding response OmpR family regulator